MHVLSFNFDGVESMRLENAQRTKYFLHEIIELDAPYFSFLSICDLFGFSLIFLLLFMVLEGVSQIENDFLRFCKERAGLVTERLARNIYLERRRDAGASW